jgi:hypothetical protein
MLLYLALAGRGGGADVAARPEAGAALAAYGASLAGGTGLAYLLFASNANRAPVCDALSPVWLSAMVGAGAVCVLLRCCRRAGPVVLPLGGGAAGLPSPPFSHSPGRTA